MVGTGTKKHSSAGYPPIMIVTEQINDKFKITCKLCGSENVTVSFYAGYIHDCGGDTGSLSVVCEKCKVEVEVDDN